MLPLWKGWKIQSFSARGWEGLDFEEPIPMGRRMILFGLNNSGKTSFSRLMALVGQIGAVSGWDVGEEYPRSILSYTGGLWGKPGSVYCIPDSLAFEELYQKYEAVVEEWRKESKSSFFYPKDDQIKSWLQQVELPEELQNHNLILALRLGPRNRHHSPLIDPMGAISGTPESDLEYDFDVEYEDENEYFQLPKSMPFAWTTTKAPKEASPVEPIFTISLYLRHPVLEDAIVDTGFSCSALKGTENIFFPTEHRFRLQGKHLECDFTIRQLFDFESHVHPDKPGSILWVPYSHPKGITPPILTTYAKIVIQRFHSEPLRSLAE